MMKLYEVMISMIFHVPTHLITDIYSRLLLEKILFIVAYYYWKKFYLTSVGQTCSFTGGGW